MIQNKKISSVNNLDFLEKFCGFIAKIDNVLETENFKIILFYKLKFKC